MSVHSAVHPVQDEPLRVAVPGTDACMQRVTGGACAGCVMLALITLQHYRVKCCMLAAESQTPFCQPAIRGCSLARKDDTWSPASWDQCPDPCVGQGHGRQAVCIGAPAPAAQSCLACSNKPQQAGPDMQPTSCLSLGQSTLERSSQHWLPTARASGPSQPCWHAHTQK